MTVGELLARASSRELAEWRAYEQEYGPLGPERGDWNAASVSHTIAMAMAGGKGRRWKIQDFLMRWGQKRRQSPEEQLSMLRGFAGRQGRRGDNR